MSIRPNDVLFYAGGECLAKFGVPVWSMNRRQRVGPVFTRSGAVGPFTGRDGVLRAASADRVRTEWLDTDGDGIFDTPALLLEAARTNLVTSDAISAWSVTGTPVVTGSISDPAGGTGAYRVADDSAGAYESVRRSVTFTGTSVRGVVFVVREATFASASQILRVVDPGVNTYLQLQISAWTAGVPTVSAVNGTYLGKRYVGNGYWAIYGQTGSIGAVTYEVEIVPTNGSVGDTGSIDVYRVNVYGSATPGWSILDASETRNVDTWYAPFTHVPQAMTVFVDFIEGEATTFSGYLWLVNIGNAADTGARFRIYRETGSDQYIAGYANAASVNAAVDINPSWGNRIRIRAVLNADGSCLIGAAKDTGSGFGAETVSGTSSPLALDSAFADTRIYLNSVGASGVGTAACISAKVVAGVRSMDEMVAVFA